MERVALLICSIRSTSARFFSAAFAGSIFFFLGMCPVYAGLGRFNRRASNCAATQLRQWPRGVRWRKQLFSRECVIFDFFQVRLLKLVRIRHLVKLLLKLHLNHFPGRAVCHHRPNPISIIFFHVRRIRRQFDSHFISTLHSLSPLLNQRRNYLMGGVSSVPGPEAAGPFRGRC